MTRLTRLAIGAGLIATAGGIGGMRHHDQQGAGGSGQVSRSRSHDLRHRRAELLRRQSRCLSRSGRLRSDVGDLRARRAAQRRARVGEGHDSRGIQPGLARWRRQPAAGNRVRPRPGRDLAQGEVAGTSRRLPARDRIGVNRQRAAELTRDAWDLDDDEVAAGWDERPGVLTAAASTAAASPGRRRRVGPPLRPRARAVPRAGSTRHG